VFLKATTVGQGSFSIYASVTQKAKAYRKAASGLCGSIKSCSACEGVSDSESGEPCDWVGEGECMARSKAESAGLKSKSQECGLEDYALPSYMRLGDDWSCTSHNPISLKWLLRSHMRNNKGWTASSQQCAEACYFANMRWAGWSGIFELGMDYSKSTTASISTGHKYIIKKTHAFYCAGFNHAEQSCSLLKADRVKVTNKGKSGDAACYVNRDNPNPCALGTNNNKWAQSTDKYWYYITSATGLMEYVEVGPKGPSKCGGTKPVFGKVGGVYMPPKADTCSGPTCEACVDHMRARQLVLGMLPYSKKSTGGSCDIVSSQKVVNVCTGDELALSCANSEVLTVEMAYYGRKPGDALCMRAPEGSSLIVPKAQEQDKYEDCYRDVKADVAASCDGKIGCKLAPRASLAGSSSLCKSIFSYLKVEYSCSGKSSSLEKNPTQI